MDKQTENLLLQRESQTSVPQPIKRTELLNAHNTHYMHLVALGGFEATDTLTSLLEHLLEVAKGNDGFRLISTNVPFMLDYTKQMGVFPARQVLQSRFSAPASEEVVDLVSAEYNLKKDIDQLLRFRLDNALTNIQYNLPENISVAERADKLVQLGIEFSHTSLDATYNDEYIEFADEPETDITGINTGISDLDECLERTHGLRRKSCSVVCGAPGQCKSTLANSIAYNALKEGKYVLIVSLEVDKRELLAKFTSRWLWENGIKDSKGNPVPSGDISTGHMDKHVRQYLIDHKDERREFLKYLTVTDNSVFSYDVFISASALEAQLRAVAQYLGGLDLVVIDHITDLMTDAKSQGKFQNANIAVGTIRKVVNAFEYEGNGGVHCLMCAQMNKEGDKVAGDKGAPRLTDIDSMSEIGKSVEYAFMTRYTPFDIEANTIRIFITKGRNIQRRAGKGDAIVACCLPMAMHIFTGDSNNASQYQCGDLNPEFNDSYFKFP